MSWQLATFAGLALVLVGGFAWYERSRPERPPGRAGRRAGGARGRRPAGAGPDPERRRDHRHRPDHRLRARRRARASRSARWRRRSPTSGSARGRGRPGRWRAGGWSGSAAPGSRRSPAGGSGGSGSRSSAALAGFAYGALLDLSVMVTYGGEQSLDRYLALSARGHPVQRRPRGRQLRDRARRRPGAGADDLALPHPARVQLAARAGALPVLLRSRCSPPAAPLAGRRPSGPARGRRRAAWLRARAERRRRLRRHRGPAVEPGDDRLGDARARGRRAQPARRAQRAARRRSPTCARRSSACTRAATSSARSWRSTAPGSTRARSPAPTWSPSCARAATATARSTARST